MDSRSRTWLAVLALVLVAGGALALQWLGGESGAAREELAPITREASAPRSAATGLTESARLSATQEPATESTRDAVVDPRTHGTLRVHGLVHNAAGEAVKNAQVHVAEYEQPEFRIEDYEPFVGKDSSDREGAFSVRVDRQGEFRVWAVMRGHSSEIASISLSPREPEAELSLALIAPRSIEGVVLDENLKPVMGANITAYVDVERMGIELPSGVTSVELFGLVKTLSNVDGTFKLSPILATGERFIVHAEVERSVPHEIVKGTRTVRGSKRTTFRAELLDVTPSSTGLSMILVAQVESAASLRLELSTDSGSHLPEYMVAQLRHIGPNGGLYGEKRIAQPVASDGSYSIPGLEPGARYELLLSWSGLAEEHSVGPVVAIPIELAVPVVLPGLFRATLRVNDPGQKVSDESIIHVVHLGAQGRRRSITNQPLENRSSSAQLELGAGTYLVQLQSRDRNTRGPLRTRATMTIEMPAHDESFTLDIP